MPLLSAGLFSPPLNVLFRMSPHPDLEILLLPQIFEGTGREQGLASAFFVRIQGKCEIYSVALTFVTINFKNIGCILYAGPPESEATLSL